MRFLIRDVIGPEVQISTVAAAGSAARFNSDRQTLKRHIFEARFPHGDEDECERCDGEAEVYEHLKSFTVSRHGRSKSEHSARTYNRGPTH